MDALLDRPPWFVIGALLGLLVIACFALINARLGVTGGFSDVVERVSGRREVLGWKAWFAFGVVGGGLIFRLLAGAPTFHGYGWLTRNLSGGVVGVVLVLAGIAIGFGAKTSGGCTSGNGLSGSSILSRAALTATATFMVTAVAVSFLIEAAI